MPMPNTDMIQIQVYSLNTRKMTPESVAIAEEA